MLDQNINRIEFYNRLTDIVLGFNNLTNEEKLQLKHWLVNTNLNENNYVENIERIFNADKREVSLMTSNISKGLEKLKKESIKEGLKEGRAKGLIEGKAEGKAEILIKLLNKKFNSLPQEYEEKIKFLPETIIDDIALDIFNIENIEELKKYF